MASSDTTVVSTTSNSDVNGNLQLVQRDVEETRKTSPDAQETKATVYIWDGSGGLTASLQTEELQTNNADHSVEVKKTTLLPDGNGNWEVSEVKENTIKEDGKNRTNEERVSHPNSEGGLSEVLRSLGEETETASGETTSTIETYSTDIAGVASDGNLHLNQRVTTVLKKNSDEEMTEQQVELPDPNSPNTSRQAIAKTKYTVQYASSGTRRTKTVQTRDINGDFNVVSVETQKSDQGPAEQVQQQTSQKPQ